MLLLFEISRPFHTKPWTYRWRLGWRVVWGWFVLAVYRLREDELTSGRFEFHDSSDKGIQK